MVRKKRKYNFSNNPIVFRPMTVYNDRGVSIQEEVERQMSQQLPPLKSDVFVDVSAVDANPPVPEVSSEDGPISSILDSIDVPSTNDTVHVVDERPKQPSVIYPGLGIETESEIIRDKSDKRLLYAALGVAAAVLFFVLNQE